MAMRNVTVTVTDVEEMVAPEAAGHPARQV